ncbi:lipoprotein, putative [Gluconacetobacter diazotrophicus PA1 5]|uniref:Lipoprotein n=1 Tax=Gluconacetobacter diazotrophicus TaxID=33996 RepID=A0A7W4I7L2_GLUDI|nr:hypothetical protein [Gluconacetobacter diazotrophicus]ACI52953.1 lipoprotein, putative [Gluconacetobacter diazotrophicus PA1 5]MBB2157730.1 hypothetical protein [Gluconacetobacter diazotrophicus]TWB08902.1 hypothetical protein FBZ86_1052 [Gluconacetobacter diazotrophicus]
MTAPASRARLAGLLPLALLAACSAQQCDPNRADLFTGIGCSAGNGYQQRTQDLDAQRNLLRLQAAQAQGNAAVAQNQAAWAQDAVAQQRQRLQAFQSRNAALRGRLAALEQSKRITAAQYQTAVQNLNEAGKLASSHDAADKARADKQQQAIVDSLSGL